MHAKMLEVCSTTLPQRVLPKLYQHPDFPDYVKSRVEKYQKRAKIAHKIFSENPYLIAPKPEGAFYYSVVFKDDKLNEKQKLIIDNEDRQNILDNLLKQDLKLDKRFAYNLMADSGIIVVPLSGFNSELNGFRLTLLEDNENKFEEIIQTISEKIKEYIEK